MGRCWKLEQRRVDSHFLREQVMSIKAQLEKEHARAAAAWVDWLNAAGKNPVHQLTWGDAALLHAARADVFGSVIKNFDGRTAAEWAQYAMDRVMREALDPASSTGAMSNLMSKMTAKAWAEIVEMCEETE
jgi:hypothetical protein